MPREGSNDLVVGFHHARNKRHMPLQPQRQTQAKLSQQRPHHLVRRERPDESNQRHCFDLGAESGQQHLGDGLEQTARMVLWDQKTRKVDETGANRELHREDVALDAVRSRPPADLPLTKLHAHVERITQGRSRPHECGQELLHAGKLTQVASSVSWFLM